MLPSGHRLYRAYRYPGEQPRPDLVWEQLDHRLISERAYRETQPEQGGTAADEFLRLFGSSRSLRRGSLYSSIADCSTRNRHGWVLCTDGARAAVAIM